MTKESEATVSVHFLSKMKRGDSGKGQNYTILHINNSMRMSITPKSLKVSLVTIILILITGQ